MFVGLFSGLAAAVFNILYMGLYGAVTGFRSPLVHAGSVAMGSISTCLAGGLVFGALMRLVPKHGVALFWAGSALLMAVSMGGPFGSQLPDGSPMPAGFAALTAPMHVIAWGVCVRLLTRAARRTIVPS